MIDDEAFRPIQYLGSKWRVLDHISAAMADLQDPRRPMVADLFAGSGVVARRLAQSSEVAASDIQEYSRVLTAAVTAPVIPDVSLLLDNAQVLLEAGGEAIELLLVTEDSRLADPRWAQMLAEDLESGAMVLGERAAPHARQAAAKMSDSSGWTLLHHYGGVYFSYRQAAELDAISCAIRDLPDPAARDTALAALLGAASDLASSIGSHFAQPVRPTDRHGALKTVTLSRLRGLRRRSVRVEFARRIERYKRLAPPPFAVRSIRADFRDALSALPDEVGAIYADPPYTRDHYSRFYHVLETIARGDQPGLSEVTIHGRRQASRGLYRIDRHQSPFSIVSQAPSAFATLFEAARARDVAVLVSYSPVPDNEKPRARVVELSDLIELARAFFPRVELATVDGVRHSKFNRAGLNAPLVDEAEVLIAARPR